MRQQQHRSEQKNADEDVSSVVQVREVSQRGIVDYKNYLAAADVKFWANLRDCLRQVQDSYLVVVDTVEKNRAKIENPKSGSSHAHMY